MKSDSKIPEGGERTIDPTENVKALQEASNNRQDDLRVANEKLLAMQLHYVEKIGEMRAEFLDRIVAKNEKHAKEIADKETDRVNAINTVNVNAAQQKADGVLNAVQLLAKATADNNTSQATATAALFNAMQTRIGALEVAKAEGQGKSQYTDPVMDKILLKLDSLSDSREKSTGKSEGVSSTVAIIISVIGSAGVIAAITFGIMALK